ncbi:hypothetical protein F503_05216 [Ophiostoma piceae UAMH 11346]|uniref:DUF676 domain-containing protein n=1 Tax=Ophiostoma piceae (strain UAMH 11346) TaxID=1262450 RepID=S3CDM9_OPHP1|nr:hypothetical protein F503_05216 [Ophiostoma piceae UAMH 11346]
MRRTLLLCFVHGFKGGDDTFGANSKFSKDLRKSVAQALPNVDVRVAVYPTYDTRGDLAGCVARFVEWLLENVIDLEVAARTPSPTVDPSVHCVLIGHSMGGIVAADALLALAGDQRIGEEEDATELNAMMFPYVHGVLGLDTPYLGIAPGVVAHTAEDQYAAASSAFNQISGLTDALWGTKSGSAAQAASRALPAAEAVSGAAAAAAAAGAAASKGAAGGGSGGGWGWGKIAMYAGAGAIASVAAGTAATVAYRNRDQITERFSWATSHLEFVNCLARGEVLRARITRVAEVNRQLGVGFGNIYTQLGKGAPARTNPTPVGAAGSLLGITSSRRTFCNLPSGQTPSGEWRPAINDVAREETGAHMAMFEASTNPNYNTLLGDARDMVVKWTVDTAWYEGSTGGLAAVP